MSRACIVIVGAGLAGDAAAAELRERGWDGRIVMIGDERERPYDRPPLSKAVLLSPDAEQACFLRPESWYADNRIELKLGDSCERIESDAHRVTLASGEVIDYAKLLLTTGASARRLPVLESAGFPVLYLRSLEDARDLRSRLVPGARIVVVGAGVIGLEVAASAKQCGCDVTVVEALDRVMARIVSPRISRYIAGVHAEQGVKILCDARICAKQDRADALLLEDGTAIVADLVVVGIGASPNTKLAQGAGLVVDDGIVVDQHTATSHCDIHAAGDVTRFVKGEGYGRAEHWRHAIDQAVVAARVIAGDACAYVENAWMWSDQYHLNIQITGEGHGDTEVLRGSLDQHAFILFHLRAGQIVGATSVNQGKHKRAITALVSSCASIDPDLLAATAVDLKKLPLPAMAAK